jgi:hypothetical protein
VRRIAAILLAALAATVVLTAAPACSAGGLVGIDGMMSTVLQEGQSSFSGLAIRARFHDARFLDAVDFLPTVEYWRNSSTIDAFGLNAVRRDATLGADARYLFPGEMWRFYAGGGYSVHFLSSEVHAPVPGLENANDSLTKGGLTVLGGVAFGTTSRIGNFIELKGHLVGGFRQLKINMGLSWNR